MTTIAVLGGSGFVGRACVSEARAQGHIVEALSAPRLVYAGEPSVSGVVAHSRSRELAPIQDGLASRLSGVDVVINTAGLADPGSASTPELFGANVLLPLVLDRARSAAAVPRLVHLSSAAVQGRRACIDESMEHFPFSAYSRSKAMAEAVLLTTSAGSVSCYRATSVHGPSRPRTRALSRFARSRWSSVAGTGAGPTPQVLVENVAAGVLYAATSNAPPPGIVLHPWEGMSCAGVLSLLSGREPARIPRLVASAGVRAAAVVRPQSALSRRLEMLWFGQRQAAGWLTREKWEPPGGTESWVRLANQLVDADR